MEKPPGSFKIFVKHPSQGLTDWLDVENDTTVEDVTKMISQHHMDLNQRDIMLKHKGFPLAEGKKLSDYELGHCSSVQIVDEEPTNVDDKNCKFVCPISVEGLMQQYEVLATETIYEFKQRISRDFGYPIKKQVFKQCGKRLDDSITLKELSYKDSGFVKLDPPLEVRICD